MFNIFAENFNKNYSSDIVWIIITVYTL